MPVPRICTLQSNSNTINIQELHEIFDLQSYCKKMHFYLWPEISSFFPSLSNYPINFFCIFARIIFAGIRKFHLWKVLYLWEIFLPFASSTFLYLHLVCSFLYVLMFFSFYILSVFFNVCTPFRSDYFIVQFAVAFPHNRKNII